MTKPSYTHLMSDSITQNPAQSMNELDAIAEEAVMYREEGLDEFEQWLRTECFQAPPAHAYDLALSAWKAALKSAARQRQADQLAAAQEALRWRSMDSAPKDGSDVLIQTAMRTGSSSGISTYLCLVGHYMPGGHCIEDHPPIEQGWYSWTGSQFQKPHKPIAWMPLPAIDAAQGDPS